jgi:RNA polymerase sigma factor (sigma-70 family)
MENGHERIDRYHHCMHLWLRLRPRLSLHRSRRRLRLRMQVSDSTKAALPGTAGRSPARLLSYARMSPQSEAATFEDAERDPRAPEVLRVLLENHARFLAFLQRRVESRDAAEDILQEAFVRSIDRAELLRSPESAVAWFYRVLRNAIVDHHRRQGTQSRAFARFAAETDGTAAGPDEELEAVACACVLAMVDTLKPEYGVAIRRVDLDGVSVRSYADEAGITSGNAGVRLHRAREALRRQLARSCGTCLVHGCLDCRCADAPGEAGAE